MTNKSIDAKVVQRYDIYFKRESDLFYKKDKILNNCLGSLDLNRFMDFFQDIQKPIDENDSYNKLISVKEGRGSIIYKFREVPARDSIAARNNYPASYIVYKLVPKLKLEKKVE